MANKRPPWSERSKAIQEKYPNSVDFDWKGIFSEDPAILGIIINDILKLDQSRIGKPGKRPSLTESSTADKMIKIHNLDYSDEPFLTAFKNLCTNRSIRGLAAKLGLDKSYIHRLLAGTASPNQDTLEKIAVGFGKHPSYFVEHRVAYILGVLEKKLTDSPESSVVFYTKLSGKK